MIKYLNLPKVLCQHAIGHHHTVGHRMVAGTTIMGIGVGTAKAAVLFHSLPLHMSLDLVGYLIHGIGAVPFVEYLLDEHQEQHRKSIDENL